ncbi:hypothetical protein F5Y01DRAFT_33665 [Xylaria sp. FL0043]|nr:hypothetical protein F5Y01DRAFT_33665 [Xylaria sp. FL0043]
MRKLVYLGSLRYQLDSLLCFLLGGANYPSAKTLPVSYDLDLKSLHSSAVAVLGLIAALAWNALPQTLKGSLRQSKTVFSTMEDIYWMLKKLRGWVQSNRTLVSTRHTR